MLTQEDLLKIEAIVVKVVDQKLEEKLEEKLEKKLEEKLDKKLDQMLDKKLDKILDKKFKEFEIQLMAKLDIRFKKIERRLSKLEREVKELRTGLNETIDWFDKRHHANLKRFERLERYQGIYNPQDPLILHDQISQNTPNS